MIKRAPIPPITLTIIIIARIESDRPEGSEHEEHELLLQQ